MRIEKIIVFLALFAVLATAVFAATVTHPAENIRAGIFGNAYAGNWSFINGSVGIGTTSPTATLQVNSSNAQGAFAVYNTSGSPLLFVNGSNGRVGIGTTTPNYLLEIASNSKALNVSGVLFVNGSSGNVGIGTTNPIRKLHINYSNAHGYLRMDRDSTDTEILLTFATGGPEKWYIGQRAAAPKGGFHIYSSDVGADVMVIDNTTGNVGIGTTTPGYLLTVANASNAVNLSGILYINGSSGNVGIGTNNPGTKLHISAGERGSDVTGMRISTDSGTGVAEDRIFADFRMRTGTPNTQLAGRIGAVVIDPAAFSAGLVFHTTSGGADGERMRITNLGSVGINTTTPTSTLHVIGTGNFSSNLYAGSCTGANTLCTDIAETIASSSKLEPGDVVVIDTNSKEKIKKSAKAYDTTVAGIVSSNPAIVLKGDQALLGREVFDYKDDVPLALAGRVPVKATAENGAIKAGDLLTTSSIPGHAMKCNDKIKCIGAIVGKALEPLDSGSGKITALVTLQ